MVLGQEDFGLYGAVGSIILFVSFFNIQFAAALGRFYACSIGRVNVSETPALAMEECRKWFATGVTIHTIVPLVLIVIGYPFGSWAVSSGLIGVPEARREACLWLWRFVCVSSFVAMVNAPFQAMYIAKQYIADLTIYTTVQVVLKTAFIYYMTLQPGDWLVRYGLAMCLFAIIPEIIICLRAVFVFPECRIRLKYLGSWPHMRQIANYAGWQSIGGLGYLSSVQLPVVIVNRVFGPSVTASYSIANTVAGEATLLNSALQGAFSPAIMTAWGEGNLPRVRSFVYQTCKIGALLTLIFAIPMALEIKEILRIWLKDVPLYAEGLCLIMLIKVVIDRFSSGFVIGVNATGCIARFQAIYGFILMLTAPLALLALVFCRHVFVVAFALLVTISLASVVNAWLACPCLGISLRYWVIKIIIPLAIVAFVASLAGWFVQFLVAPSFFRIVLTTLVSVSVLAASAWLFMLTTEEKQFIKAKLVVRCRGLLMRKEL